MKPVAAFTILAVLLPLCAGCATKNYNVSNPVVGPPPPRVNIGRVVLAQSEESTELEQVKYEPEAPLADEAVVAQVNGQPVLAADILEPYAPKLAEFRAKAPPAEYRRIQDMLIKRDLNNIVIAILAADAVKTKLKKDQLESVEQQLDDGFDNFVIPKLKETTGAGSLSELEAILQAQGGSLESIRKTFGQSEMLKQYRQSMMGDEPKPSRADLLARYQKQKDKYSQPQRVKWQQLQVSIARYKTEPEARKVIEQAGAQIHQGTDFGEVVKKLSDGPLKENGGNYDWTQPSSLASPEVRQALETLRAGQVSEVIKTGGMLQLVKVTERQEAGFTSFDDVQNDLREEYINEWRTRRSKEVLDDLRAKAVVETIYDEAPAKSAIVPQ